jgi:hypothetical protein
MLRTSIPGLCFALLALFGPIADAAPITLSFGQFTGLENVGVPDGTTINSPSGIDLTIPSTTLLGTKSLVRTTNPDGSFPAQSIPIDDRFRFAFTLPAVPGSSTPPPTVLADGYITGTFTGAAGDPNLSGSFTGTANWAQLYTQNPSDSVPPALRDLALHPERIHIQGVVPGGAANTVQTSLVIDPPAGGGVVPPAIPEPSSLAVFFVVMAGSAWRFRRARVG